MARTRLRGISIGGIQIGIEVPEIFEWRWPESPVSEFQCLPRDPEVHVGLRVGEPGKGDLGGERYQVGGWTFEVARRGEDWLLGLSRRGQRAQLAHFDREFRLGEIVVSPETAWMRAYPLRGPIDEWIVLHRTLARGGLCLNASAWWQEGAAVIRLGDPPNPALEQGARRATNALIGRSGLLVREERDHLRLFRSPWSEAIDPRLPFEARIDAFERVESTDHAWTERLDPAEAADLLVNHAIVPLSDELLLDRVLRNARRIAEEARVTELGMTHVASASARPTCPRDPREPALVSLRPR